MKQNVQDAWARWKIRGLESRLEATGLSPLDPTGLLVNGYRDRFVIADATVTTYPLTLVPRKDTLNLFLNGLALDEGIDYTVNYTAPSITLISSATRAVGDVLWGRYLTANTAPTVSTILTWGIRSDTATIIGTFDAVALIDGGGAFGDISGHVDPGTGEACLVFGSTSLEPGVDGEYLFLRVGNSPGLWHFTRISGVDNDASIQNIAALTGAADYAVTRSGAVLTVTRNGTTEATVTLTGSDLAALSNTLVGMRGTHATSIAISNFEANSSAVLDSMTKPNADQLGHASTGQTWVGTS